MVGRLKCNHLHRSSQDAAYESGSQEHLFFFQLITKLDHTVLVSLHVFQV